MTQERETQATAAQIVAQAKDLTSLPDIYFRVKKVLDNPASSHDDVAAAIATDPGMSARLLRVANSAFYGRPSSIPTIPRAVVLLGTQQVHDLVLATTVIQSFAGMSSDLVKPREFWRCCLFAGSAAKILAEQNDILDCERLFVAGLLAQVGLLILYQELPTQMRAIMQEAQGADQDIAAQQREQLGFDYAQISADLFALWQLPAALVDPIRLHTDPSAAGDGLLEAAILHVAVRLAMIEARRQPVIQTLPFVNDDAWQILDLSVDRLQQIRSDALTLTEEMVPALLNAA